VDQGGQALVAHHVGELRAGQAGVDQNRVGAAGGDADEGHDHVG